MGRLNLLHQITRAIGERQDLPSIFQVVIDSVEDNLPVDFGCICLYEPGAETLTVKSVGARSEALAIELALSAQARIDIDENGLSRCVDGQLVYEPDIRDASFPFPQRLARVGLRSFVAAPLLVESRVFGVLITARREAGAFSSGECEFLRQLSEHVALAAHQSQLHTALQQAYDDLRADATGGHAAGTASRSRADGERHCPRHQQRHVAGGTLRGVVVGAGEDTSARKGASTWRSSSARSKTPRRPWIGCANSIESANRS